MPFPIPFAWTRTRGSMLATRALQQIAKRRVSVWDPTDDVRLFSIPLFWLTKQRRRSVTLRVYLARGLFGGKSLASLSLQAAAIGAANSEGAEIVAEDMILARVGADPFTGIGTAPLEIATNMETDAYVDVDFRMEIPTGADTLGRFAFDLVFASSDDTPWLGEGSPFEQGFYYGGLDPSVPLALTKERVVVTGCVFTAAERTSLAAGGLDFPADTVF